MYSVDVEEDVLDTSTAEDFLRGRSDAESNDRVRVIYVLPCNKSAVDVYRLCSLNFVGMSGTCTGITAEEVRSAFWLQGLMPDAGLAEDVRYMGWVASSYLNEQAKRKQGGGTSSG